MANPHLKDLKVDYLYHLGLDTSMDIAFFQDVKFVLMGGSAARIKGIMKRASDELPSLSQRIPQGLGLATIGKNERYSMYKLGSIVCVNHGMGAPSLSILVQEMFKLLSYANAKDVTIIRMGTCGGLGVAPGTVVVSSGALNSALEPVYTQHVLGKAVDRSTTVDQELVSAIVNCNSNEGSFEVMEGWTMSCNGFYEEQARIDGYFCDFTVQERAAFLRQCHEMGVRNIEMEACAFLAFCFRAKFKAAVVCVALLDRLKGDQITSSPAEIAQFEVNCINAVFNYIKHKQA